MSAAPQRRCQLSSGLGGSLAWHACAAPSGKGAARMSTISTTAHARGRKLAIAALLTLGLALPLSGTAPAAQNSQFTFPGLGGKNQNQDTDDTCPKGQMSPGGLLKGGNKNQDSARNLIVKGGTCKVNTAGSFYYKAINILNGGVLQFTEPTTDKKDINFWASSIIIENGGKLVAGTKNAPFGSNGGSLTF